MVAYMINIIYFIVTGMLSCGREIIAMAADDAIIQGHRRRPAMAGPLFLPRM